MTKLFQIYKCGICGNMVEVISTGKGELVCCGKPMDLFKENVVDASTEKHIPVSEKTDGNLKVKVGSIPHPMEKEHYIEWIELIDENGKAYRQFLKPGDDPEALFCVKIKNKPILREFCNIHGLWKG